MFKLEKERVPCCKYKHLVFCVHKKAMKVFDQETETILTTLQPPGKSIYNNNPRIVAVNPHAHHEYQVILQYD